MRPRSVAGFTLIELLIALVVAVALAAIAVPAYRNYVERMKVDQAETTIAKIAMEIERYRNENNAFPQTLAAMGISIPLDPWGHPYQYLAIDVANPPNIGQVMKDRSMHPLNSDFDLYSMGENGQSILQLSNPASADEVIRAGNGSFIGLAKDY